MSHPHRFFVEGEHSVRDEVVIAGGDARKIVRVLRLVPGDSIEIVDSTAKRFAASIESAGDAVQVTLRERIAQTPDGTSSLQIDVAQAIPKAQRMEFVVEKCTELGAAAFLPFYCERSVARRVGAEKLARWRRLARTAAAQSGRNDIPVVTAPLDFAALLKRFAGYHAICFAWEMAPSQLTLRERLPGLIPRAGRVLAVVGPEGGFTHDEAAAAVEHGAQLVWLGPRILRTDTAAMVLLAVIGTFAS
ncbi:MAG: 16S rRNA (uracil(1498)-N(3))-methyltransferase [Candidatus Eremiobacteraeota bacterium]|nr:16S rRNA (uracil(1498)-N(3))-methyltransferase [Candidatus Eremiobacteraeota bacterium]